MGLKSKMKIFWSEHRDPILFYIIIIVGILLLIKGLNKLAGNRLNENEANNEIEISFQENKENKKLIDEFLQYCRNKQIEKAYDLISDKCKKEKYNTVSSFEKNYYNKIFNQNKNIEIEKQENNTYKITFYNDMLETGKIDKENNIVDYYKIEDSIMESKIYINLQNNIK